MNNINCIRIKCENNIIKIFIEKKLNFMNANSFYIKYPYKIDNIPYHLLYYMICILLSEIISWNSYIIYVDELTKKEEESINYHIKKNYEANRYKRCMKDKINSIVKSKKYIIEYKFENYGPIFCCNGLGRDGLLLNLLTKEIYNNMESITIKNQYISEELFNEKYKIAKNILEKYDINENIIETNYMKICKYKIIPWWILIIPFLVINKSNIIYMGLSLEEFNSYKKENPCRFLISQLSLKNISDTLNIKLSSPFSCISMPFIQKLLIEKYPDSLEYQLSCMRNKKWCNDCEKCIKTTILYPYFSNNIVVFIHFSQSLHHFLFLIHDN
jgi:hypothetical protein